MKPLFRGAIMAGIILLLNPACSKDGDDNNNNNNTNKVTITLLEDDFFGGLNSIARDAAGVLYVTHNENGIASISPSGVFDKFYAGTVEPGYLDGPKDSAKFQYCWGIATDKNNFIYLGDEGNNRIRKIGPDGMVTTVAGTGDAGYKDGPVAEAQFKGPMGVAVDKDGNIIVADYGNSRIRKISPQGMVSTVGGAKAFAVVDVATDGSGNIFATDYADIYKITPQGTVTKINSAPIYFPSGLVTDAQGNLYFTVMLKGIIGKITPAGQQTTILNTGISMPKGIDIDPQGNLYIADWGDKVYKVSFK